MSDDMADELRPIDYAKDAADVSADAAELAEHIRDTEPQSTKEQQMNLLINLIDQAHGSALTTYARLDDE